jgi:hypothetical protein
MIIEFVVPPSGGCSRGFRLKPGLQTSSCSQAPPGNPLSPRLRFANPREHSPYSFNLQFAICNCQFAILVFLIFSFPSLAFAQVIRLPAVSPEEQNSILDQNPFPSAFPGKLLSHPDSSAQILAPPGETISPGPAEPPQSDIRSGFFQRAIFNATYLPRTAGSRGFGQNDLETKLVVALPCPTTDSPLVITPGFTAHYLDGPADVDLPPRLFDCYSQFRWLAQVTPQWGLDFAITPGWYSDFQQGSSKAFRMPAHAAAAWTLNPTTKLVLGAAYLARFDVNFIPVGGIIWTPNDDLKCELLFPEPKIARRILHERDAGGEINTWLYMAGEFAGDVWAIEMQNGENEQVLLRDCRLIFGIERKKIQGFGAKLEIGYVFSRRILYSGNTPEFDPGDTILLRAGVQY